MLLSAHIKRFNDFRMRIFFLVLTNIFVEAADHLWLRVPVPNTVTVREQRFACLAFFY